MSINKTLEACIAKIAVLPEEDLALLLSCMESRQLKKGERLLKEGEICHLFYMVEKGYLRTYYNKDGVAINLNFTFEGDFTTNIKSYKNRQPSMQIIEAGEETQVWIFNLRSISGEFAALPQLSRFTRRLIIHMLLASEEHSHLLKIYTPAERYRYIEKNKPMLLQRISLSQIASYLGVSRETISRIRAQNH